MDVHPGILQYFSQRLKVQDDVHFAVTSGFEITSAFQRIVDKDNKLIGYEALLRPFKNGRAHAASEFLDAMRKDKKIELIDRLVRALHYRNFSLLSVKSPFLFLNYEYESLTDMNNMDTYRKLLLKRQSELGITHLSTVIEILEHQVKSEHWLMMMSQWRRKNDGILIALDDIIDSESVWDRIRMIQPDIVKIDKSMLYAANYSDFVRRLKQFSMTVLQEGIETEQHKNQAILAGVDLLQGYYIGYPRLISLMKAKESREPLKM